MSIAVAVSGGMDSLYSLLTLQGNARDVLAVHARFCPNPDLLVEERLSSLCKNFGIEFHILDLRQEFAELVIRPFAAAYAKGKTPNPCAHCNRLMKFGLLLKEVRQLGADHLATGHYVSLEDHPKYGLTLRCGKDTQKDQSYFLSLIAKESLPFLIFPLAKRCKRNVKEELHEHHIVIPAEHESQEICFVPKDDYRAFLQTLNIHLPAGGPMIVGDGLVVGHHQGLWQYTEGQRRGLGIAWSEPLYVIGKDRERNALLLGTAAELKSNGCVAARINLLVEPEKWSNDLFVRTRYHQKLVPADILIQGQRMLVRFQEPQLPSAPGQLVTVYDADGYVLAGGIIYLDN